MIRAFYLFVYILLPIVAFTAPKDWEIGPFIREDNSNPIINPISHTTFFCPVQQAEVHWESDHTFNPAAITRDGKVYLFYRAEDNYGNGIGMHTSRLGLAISQDGVHFIRGDKPILYPDQDSQKQYEFPGGCEDPRVVETEDGTYVMMYTQWNRQVAVLGVATSKDLISWEKHGYAFEGNMKRKWSKAGSVVCRIEGDRLIATKVNGKYWMYFGEGNINVATSDDLISWNPLQDTDRMLISVLTPRKGKFDSALVEPGPPAITTRDGIILLYNGKNSSRKGDKGIPPAAYSGGQVLFDLADPTKIVSRCEECFFTPMRAYERKGQYLGGTVFIQGLAPLNGDLFLYYGTADSSVGVAKMSCFR